VTTPATYTDLQTALNDATSGDTLQITGECTGNFSTGTNLTFMGMPNAVLNGNNSGTVLSVGSGASVTITNLLITDGDSGGIDNSGTVTLNGNTQVDNNTTSYFSGGIWNHSGATLILNDNAQVNNNSAPQGAGIYNQGTLTLDDDAQVDGNTGGQGGGIYNNSGTVTLNGNAQVDHNSATAYFAPSSDEGGGIWNGATVNMTGNAQVEGNTASASGGAIFGGGGTVGSCQWTGALAPNSPNSPPTPTAYTGCTG
jgi:predicted outer membrane repeat protein